MCYVLCKNGKNKQSNSSTQGQSENQYGKQPGDPNTYPATVNQSYYGRQLLATASFDEDPPQVTYEAVSNCQ